MKPRISAALAVALSGLSLAGCGDPEASLAEARPATGEELKKFSREINHQIKVGRDGALIQRLCKNMSNAPCPPDTIEKLKAFGFETGKTGVDLGYAFVLMAADAKDGVADQKSSDEDFVVAVYRVILGREPDPEGEAHHLRLLKDQGMDRKAMVLGFLKSAEFITLK